MESITPPGVAEAALAEFTGKVKVTDRNLEENEMLSHFNHKDLPQNTKILNVGSGLHQQLEKDLKEKRPDIQVTSIDPSLIKENIVVRTPDGGEKTTKIDLAERKNSLPNKDNTVAALGQILPFAAATFDMVLDVHGPAQYSGSEEKYIQYLKEVLRVLKPGGKLHIYNPYFGDILVEDEDGEKKSIQKQEEMLKSIEGNKEIYVQKNGLKTVQNGVIYDDKRVGVIITKPNFIDEVPAQTTLLK